MNLDFFDNITDLAPDKLVNDQASAEPNYEIYSKEWIKKWVYSKIELDEQYDRTTYPTLIVKSNFWLHSKINGYHLIKSDDGYKSYKGDIKDGQLHGLGRLYEFNDISEGVFIEGTLVKGIKIGKYGSQSRVCLPGYEPDPVSNRGPFDDNNIHKDDFPTDVSRWTSSTVDKLFDYLDLDINNNLDITGHTLLNMGRRELYEIGLNNLEILQLRLVLESLNLQRSPEFNMFLTQLRS